MASIPQWCDLPPELLGLVVARLRDPADRARSRAVCRPWHLAVRHHGPSARRQLPWVVLWEGDVITPSDGRGHHLPYFPDNATCLGSTDHWLAIGLGEKRVTVDATYFDLQSHVLHNPFSNTSMPLTELDDIIHGNSKSKVNKFLMRSTLDDFVVVITSNRDHPLIVFRQGKGAWLPEPRTAPYIHVIDVAFLGDRLYAITKAGDLIPFDLSLDGEGRPMVTIGRRVIRQPPGYDGYDAWPMMEDEGDQSEEEDAEEEEDEDDQDEEEEEEHEQHSDDDHEEEEDLNYSIEYTTDRETNVVVTTSRHLIESCGKLFMVVHQHQADKDCPGYFRITSQVDVFEADLTIGAWVRVTSGCGGGRALFVSLMFSKSVSAPCGDIKEDVIYFIDTGEAFNMKTRTFSQLCRPSLGVTWLFPPELVL